MWIEIEVTGEDHNPNPNIWHLSYTPLFVFQPWQQCDTSKSQRQCIRPLGNLGRPLSHRRITATEWLKRLYNYHFNEVRTAGVEFKVTCYELCSINTSFFTSAWQTFLSASQTALFSLSFLFSVSSASSQLEDFE